MKLKSCPFCGGEARYQKITDTMGDLVFVGYIVKCTKCFATPLPNNYTGDKKKAAERWNRREPIDRIVEQLEKASTKEGAEWVRLQREGDVKSVPETDIHSYASSCYDHAIEILKRGVE